MKVRSTVATLEDRRHADQANHHRNLDQRSDHQRKRRGTLLRVHALLVAFSRGVPLFKDASSATLAYSWLAQRPRIGAPREIHAALHLAQRVILMLFHPSDHLLSNRFETLRPVLE